MHWQSDCWTNWMTKENGIRHSRSRKTCWTNLRTRRLRRKDRARPRHSTSTAYELHNIEPVLETLRRSAGGRQKAGAKSVRALCCKSVSPEPALQTHSFHSSCVLGPRRRQVSGRWHPRPGRDHLVLDRNTRGLRQNCFALERKLSRLRRVANSVRLVTDGQD